MNLTLGVAGRGLFAGHHYDFAQVAPFTEMALNRLRGKQGHWYFQVAPSIEEIHQEKKDFIYGFIHEDEILWDYRIEPGASVSDPQQLEPNYVTN